MKKTVCTIDLFLRWLGLTSWVLTSISDAEIDMTGARLFGSLMKGKVIQLAIFLAMIFTQPS